MSVIHTDAISKTIKKLCLIANTHLPKNEYLKLCELYEKETCQSAKNSLWQILENAKIANLTNRPLCQDTGFVTAFMEIGQEVKVVGGDINSIINKAVADAYKDFYFRKSILNSPIERINTNTNTPILIHTEIVSGENIKILLSVKGGGCENVSAFKMLSPSQDWKDIENFVLETVKNASSKPCPPIKVGIGIGSNFEGSAILSKKALLSEKSIKKFESFENNLKNKINALDIGAMGLGGTSTCFDVKVMESPCHIASLPVSVSISCHSSRHASAVISENSTLYELAEYDFPDIKPENITTIKVNTNEIEKIKNISVGSNIELTGKIYTARDAAHKKLASLIREGKELPFDINNAIIFYAGPCPANIEEIIGPIGPTTSARMDIYTKQLYEKGLLATIGKGERSFEIFDTINKYEGKYFTVTGGVASYLKNCIKNVKLVAYPELGTEAIYELEVVNLPLIVKI